MKTLCLAAIVLASVSAAPAVTINFGSNANSLNGVATGVINTGGLSLTVAAGPAGALLDERDNAGIGVNSRAIGGVADGSVDKFDLLGGTPPLNGSGESMTFTFDTPGVLTAIDFDGVKDESLEYFVLTTASGGRYTFFDSAANVSVPGAVDAAVGAGVVTGEVIYLLEGGGLDDEVAGLSIPFAAGETLTLTYAELGPTFNPLLIPNGARFQGLTVTALPEPAAVLLLTLAMAGAVTRGRGERR